MHTMIHRSNYVRLFVLAPPHQELVLALVEPYADFIHKLLEPPPTGFLPWTQKGCLANTTTLPNLKCNQA